MKKRDNVCLFLSLSLSLFLLFGCKENIEEPKEIEPNGSIGAVVLERSIRENSDWSVLNSYAEYLGKSMNDTFLEMYSMMEYRWYDGGSEAFLSETGYHSFFFGEGIIDGDCVGVNIRFSEVFIDQNYEALETDNIAYLIKKKFEVEPQFIQNGDNSFYEYCFEDVKFRFCTSEDGLEMDKERGILIVSANWDDLELIAGMGFAELEGKSQVIETKTANGRLNALISYLGQTREEILNREPLFIAKDEHSLSSPKSDFVLVFREEEDTCRGIETSSGYLFGIEGEDFLTIEELKADWKLSFSWWNFDTYYFDLGGLDHFISIESEKDGKILNTSKVYIK